MSDLPLLADRGRTLRPGPPTYSRHGPYSPSRGNYFATNRRAYSRPADSPTTDYRFTLYPVPELTKASSDAAKNLRECKNGRSKLSARVRRSALYHFIHESEAADGDCTLAQVLWKFRSRRTVCMCMSQPALICTTSPHLRRQQRAVLTTPLCGNQSMSYGFYLVAKIHPLRARFCFR